MIEVREIKKVLQDTRKIVKHHKELSIAKGDHFNLFSVLDIETKENKTHSAFLSELLNPKGSHLLGDVFLNHFLTVIKQEKEFNYATARVKVEHSIGTINLYNKKGEDKSKATGGRIDIYLEDINANIICIENKIHASDQEAQIQRYYNHKTVRNTVYYLTLNGESPSESSCLKLNSEVDFYNISYRTHIIAWLELCLKEVPNFTSLREAINQYILLIKKLTHMLNKEEQKALSDTIVNHLEESKIISDNYQTIVQNIQDQFRKELISRLHEHFEEGHYTVKSELPVHQNYSKIWIHFKNRPEVPFSYCVEPFNGKGNKNGAMFVGLHGHNKAACKTIPVPNRLNEVWQHVQWMSTDEYNRLHLDDAKLLKLLANPKSEQYNKLVTEVFNQIVTFIDETNAYILKPEVNHASN